MSDFNELHKSQMSEWIIKVYKSPDVRVSLIYTSPQMSEYHEDTQVPSCQTIVKDKVTQVPGIAESVSLSHTSPGYHSECIIKLHKYQVSLSVYK